LESIVIQTSIEVILEDVFQHCFSFGFVTFESPSVLRAINKGAFEKSVLDIIVIPRLVEEMNEQTFHECTSFVSITYEASSMLREIRTKYLFAERIDNHCHSSIGW
jgi:hypothetical protein